MDDNGSTGEDGGISHALQDAVREEFHKKNYGNVVALLRQGKEGTSENFREELFLSAMAEGIFDIVRFLVEEGGLHMTGSGAIIAAGKAAGLRQEEVALYLSEKAIEKGAAASDAWQWLFHHALLKDHDALADRILAQTALERGAALEALMQAAVESKSFPVMGTLIDKGAKPTVAALSRLVEDPAPAFYDEEEAYNALLRKFLATGLGTTAAADPTLLTAARLYCEDRQRLETLTAFLAEGADPCANREQAWRVIAGHVQASATFAGFRYRERMNSAVAFENLFGGDFRVADLLAPIDADTRDTGLMLAARAGLLKDVMDKALAEEPRALSIAHLVETNARGQSVLTIAVDRGFAEDLLGSHYWNGQEREVLAVVQRNLSEDQLAAISLEKFQAAHTRHRLGRDLSRARWKL